MQLVNCINNSLFIRNLCIIYQTYQKSELYLFMSIIMHDKPLWTLFILEEQNELYLICGVYVTAMCYALQPIWIDDPLIGLNFSTFNMSCHHPWLRIDAMYWMLFLFRCVSTSPRLDPELMRATRSSGQHRQSILIHRWESQEEP
jgi:hypothetical protein